MDAEQMNPQVRPSKPFICSLCGKTFEQEAPCKRHYYYCRSKPADTKGSRRRSCTACVRAKARCVWSTEAGAEVCARCQKRGVECDFELISGHAGPSNQATSNNTTSALEGPNFSEGQAGVVVGQQIHQSNSGSTDLVPGQRPVQVQVQVQEGASVDNPFSSTPMQTYQDTVISESSEPLLLYDASSFFDFDEPSNVLGTSNINNNVNNNEELVRYRQRASSSMNMSVACDKIRHYTFDRASAPVPWVYQPAAADCNGASLFTPRAFARQDHVSLASLAMRHLRSYPFMMLVKGRLPPFINRPTCPWAPTGENYHTRQSLVNCALLVQAFNSQRTGNKSWMWGRIWYEQERILAEYVNFDRWELLASLQALLVYCLLRLSDAPAGHAVFDVGLLNTVNLVSQALASSIDKYFDCNLPEDPTIAWRDWVFVEMRRRTVLIFQILGLLVDISTTVSYMALGGLVLVPLPSTSTLWSTQNYERWKAAYVNWRESHVVYGVSERGLLMRLQGTETGIISALADWEGWMAEVGDLGSLVMIVGELLRNQ